MWRPPVDFITLHYAWILFAGLLSFPVFYPFGNLQAIDVYFFGASASTESGLNTIDVNTLPLYQQLYIYVIPIITNLGFINIVVVVIRLYWFNKKLGLAASTLNANSSRHDAVDNDLEAQQPIEHSSSPKQDLDPETTATITNDARTTNELDDDSNVSNNHKSGNITFSPDVNEPKSQSSLYIPPPQARDRGKPFVEMNEDASNKEDNDDIKGAISEPNRAGLNRRKPYTIEETSFVPGRGSGQNIAESIFVLGATRTHDRQATPRTSASLPHFADLPGLSRQVTIGRNSRFQNLTELDRERLGGIEYRSLKLLLKIIISYFCGVHALGVILLLPWIHRAPAKYIDYLAECGIDKTWWAFYSAQTMVNNLGFTLTPDSMASFKDATWPLLVMTFLAYAGNTCYPILLRLVIWTMCKLVPKSSSTRECLQFLLDHPRRCYTLLFPSHPTWILFFILLALNFIDVLLIIILDLYNPSVNDLPIGPRILSALFQAAQSRHTGAATINLYNVNPAVQFSLLVMMYVSALPIAISIRASNTYEERSLGIYAREADLDESDGRSYIMTHLRNQLSFDLWYMFLGTFIICIAEAKRIIDTSEPAFAVFPVFFEVVSAYANVGLSLGHPNVSTSLAGQFKVISKLVICASMIRGRHRGLPYALDKAITLPSERRAE